MNLPLSDRAQQALHCANQEAQRFNHERIGTEHLLLGIIKEGSEKGFEVLLLFEADLRTTRKAVETVVGRGGEMLTPGKLALSERAEQAIESARQAARSVGRDAVDTECLLLGVLNVDAATARQVLRHLSLDPDDIREVVRQLLEESSYTWEIDPPATARLPHSPKSPSGVGPVAHLPLSDRARIALHCANQEAHRLNHERIGTEHLLLGIIKERGGHGGAEALRFFKLDLRTARTAVEQIVRSGDTVVWGKLPLSERAKQAIASAQHEAHSAGQDAVDAARLLLGVLNIETATARQVLRHLGLEPDDVAQVVRRILEDPSYIQENDPPATARLPVSPKRRIGLVLLALAALAAIVGVVIILW